VAECGWESRDLRNLLDEHWTRQDPAVYESEREAVGDLDHLDTPAKRVTIGSGSSAPAVRQILETARVENPDEPLWKGVDSIEETAKGVEVGFHRGYDPELRSAGGVEVACVLYPTPVTPEPARDEGDRRR
jgi:peptide/nickel transport system ATP-binding protein